MIKHLPALVNVFVNAFTYNFYLLRRCLEILPESRCLPGRLRRMAEPAAGLQEYMD